MALSFSTNFTSDLHRNNDIFPIVTIAGDTVLYLSTREITIESQVYDGRLLNAPQITSSINFRQLESRTNNITLKIANNDYEATLGDRINKIVTIYFATDKTLSDLSDCLKVFTGRVVSIAKITPTEISLNCEDYASWRYNTILQSQVNTTSSYNAPGNKMFRSRSYGDFTANASTETNPGLCTSLTLRPLQYITQDSDYLYYDEGINNAGGRPHIYVNGLDKFIPIEQATSDNHDKFDTNVIRVNNDDNPDSNKAYFRNSIRLYPTTQATNSNLPSVIQGKAEAIANSIDNDTDTFVTLLADPGGSGTEYRGVGGEFAGTLIGTLKTVKATIQGRSTSGQTMYAFITAGDGTAVYNQEITTANGWSFQLNNSNTLIATKDVTTLWVNNAGGVNLNGVVFGAYQKATNNAQTGKVYEMFIDFTSYLPIDETNGKSQEQEIPKQLYLGTDGTSFDDTNISDHGPTEVHENLLINIGPGASFIDGTTQGQVEAKFDASGLVRCTIDDEDMTLQQSLLKLQKEAGFISYIKPSDGKVYYLIEEAEDRSSAPTSNADLTVSDYNNVVFGTIPLSQMLWSITTNFNKHIAQNNYLSSTTHTDTTTQSAYSFGANDGTLTLNNDWVNENIAAKNLLKLFKYPRVTVSLTIVNPLYYILEIGDIIRFTDPPSNFRLRGGNFTDYYFRVTETSRTVNELKIIALEIYKA